MSVRDSVSMRLFPPSRFKIEATLPWPGRHDLICAVSKASGLDVELR